MGWTWSLYFCQEIVTLSVDIVSQLLEIDELQEVRASLRGEDARSDDIARRLQSRRISGALPPSVGVLAPPLPTSADERG